ncbi:MAG: DUF4296 domain-containing protein [Candidatus Cryptobacteroides sp.]
MTRRSPHILCAVALVLLLIGCSKGPRVIPRGKMARIYAEMFVTDQWINSTPSVKRIADTSLVYEPILEKYGYTSDDYRKSVEVYMDDPERFSRILRTTVRILDKEIASLKGVKEELDKPKFVIKTDFRAEDFFPFLSSEPYVHFYDSLAVECDTCGFYRFSPVERADTIYDRLEMKVLVDSLSVADTAKEAVIPIMTEKIDTVPDLLQMSQQDAIRRPARDTTRRSRRLRVKGTD